MKKRIYICSPYAGDVIMNKIRAKEWSKKVFELGYIPICVHIYLEDATGMHENKGDRDRLLKLGREFVEFCDELWIFGDRISEGMKGEIEYANRIGIPIYYKR